MNIQKFKAYIFKNTNEERFKVILGLTISFIISLLIYMLKDNSDLKKPALKELEINLAVMIPQGYILYPFQAVNFEHIQPLLSAYNIVQVYNPKTGTLIAKNIKILRAPKDPSHLAFVVPVDIANKLASFGLEFKIALQKYINKPPVWMLNKKSKNKITFGG